MMANKPRCTKSPEVMDEIVHRISEGESLRSVCRDKRMPSIWTVMDWQRDDADFASRCARARELQAEVMDEKILSVADRVETGEMDPNSARVVLSAYQWRAAKLAPKKYGDMIKLAGHDGGAVKLIAQSDDEKL
jgi:hypothetical protein